MKNRQNLFCIVPLNAKINIEITGKARAAMKCKRVAAHDQILNLVRVQQLEQLFEVGVEFHSIVPLSGRPLQYAPWPGVIANIPHRASQPTDHAARLQQQPFAWHQCTKTRR
jgi:hypothetical protein